MFINYSLPAGISVGINLSHLCNPSNADSLLENISGQTPSNSGHCSFFWPAVIEAPNTFVEDFPTTGELSRWKLFYHVLRIHFGVNPNLAPCKVVHLR